ncbi:uncharacterized protein [Arachis hypogaea]|nr:myb-like protein X isoform X1 [Arachis hypogaea]
MDSDNCLFGSRLFGKSKNLSVVSKLSMIRRSPSRNQRSKGIKVKHVLQIILLLCVCFWLIYQIKHSHDKKKEFDDNTAHQIPKLGRKDLNAQKVEINQNEKHEEEVEDENIVEEEDENKHELHEQEELQEGKEESQHGVRGQEEEQDEDENKGEEMEDRQEVGDDEIAEKDKENSGRDINHDELIEEEKDKEEESEDEEKEEGSVENHNTHEAREEHYKGDDASSAVTRDTHSSSTETETTFTEESSGNQTDLDIKVTGAQLMPGETSNTTSGKETVNKTLPIPADSSHLNNTNRTHSHNNSETSSNLTVALAASAASNNMTGTGADTSSKQNNTGIFSESDHAQNNTVNVTVTGEGTEQGSNRGSEENLPDSEATDPIKTENGDVDAAAGEFQKVTRFVALNKTVNKDNSETSNRRSNSNLNMKNTDVNDNDNEKLKDDTQTGESGESSESFTGKGTTGSDDHNATDSHVIKDVMTDPDKLAGIRNGIDNSDKSAIE